MNANRSAGIDKISVRLQEAGTNILKSLHLYIPRKLEISRVTPINKFHDKAKCGDYGLIFVISNVATILEKFIYNQLYYISE